MKGRIIRGIGGFYYVDTSSMGILECKAKGVFRKDKKKPLVGDFVEISILPECGKGNIEEILARKNELIRPAVANVDQALVIFSVKSPVPNLNLLDRFLLTMYQKEIPCIIIFNKSDLANREEIEQLSQIYQSSGGDVLFVSAKMREEIDRLKGLLKGKVSTVAGPSGVGKSSIINLLQEDVSMETGEISEKIERGKHTTRHSEFIPLEGDGFIMDTPGFTSLSLFNMEGEEVRNGYPEFSVFTDLCRFHGCTHTHEPGCAVKKAVEEKKISQVRYNNYLQIYREMIGRKEIKDRRKGKK